MTLRKLRYMFEFALFSTCMLVSRCLPVDAASGLGGALGRLIGPFTKKNQIALENLELAWPRLSQMEKTRITKAMWDNLGRVFFEYPHLKYIAKNRVHFENDQVLSALKLAGKPALFATAHMGNWELGHITTYKHHNLVVAPVFRALNNPYIDKKIRKYRSVHDEIPQFPKSSKGMRDMIKFFKTGRSVAILFDQKYNQGPALPFFGHEARTSTAIADLALKYDITVIPGRFIREKGARFRAVFDAPLSASPAQTTEELQKRSIDLTCELLALLENWIRHAPSQWLWAHRRWPSS